MSEIRSLPNSTVQSENNEPWYLTDPVSWNSAWEESESMHIPADVTDLQSEFYSGPEECLEANLMLYRHSLQKLRSSQEYLSIGIKALVAFGFRGGWQSLDPVARRGFMLQGHVRSAIHNRGDGDRKHVCDIKLDDLERGGGAGFLDLLDLYFLNDGPIPRTFPRPGGEQVPGAGDAVNALRAVMAVMRDTYLSVYQTSPCNSQT